MASESSGNEDMGLLTSRIAALEELLDVYEKSVLEQTDKLYSEISERKLAEKRIGHLASFREKNPNAIIEIDLEGKITYANPAAGRLFPGLMKQGLSHPLFSGWTAVVNDFKKGGEVVQTEVVQTRELKVGGFFYEQSIHYLSETGRIRIYNLDITRSKAAEETLQEQIKFTSSLIEGSPVATIVIDSEHAVRLWNKACERLTGKSAKEMVGTSNQWQAFYDHKRPIVADLIIDGKGNEDMARYYKTFSKSILGTAGLHAEGWYNFQGNNVYMLFDASPIVDSSGKVVAAIETLQDMTELKRTEEYLAQKNIEIEKAHSDLKSVQSQLLQQEKMASIGQLAAGVAHEINNPTGYILSNLNSLGKYAKRYSEYISLLNMAVVELAGGGKDVDATLDELEQKRKALKIDYVLEDIKQLIQESIDGAERIKRIVQDLKSFSHVDDTEYKPANINDGLESTINIVWNELKYKATVKKEFGNIPLVRCNLGQLNQVFMNILLNAAQAIEKQGEIIVKTWCDSDHVYISIADTGSGIPEDKINRIFEPFYTTKDIGKGTGLGLSIAYDIVKKHAGEIGVESESGKGTAFTIKIPRAGG